MIANTEGYTMQNTAAEKMNEGPMEWDAIDTCSRAEAIRDGVLVDLTALFPDDTSRLKYPVARTAAVWNLIKTSCERTGKNPGGYVWDLCRLAKYTGKLPDPTTKLFKFSVACPGRARTYKIVCGPGDELGPVFTIMFPNED
jgi:hypothetical protein